MLTAEVLKANSILTGLSDDQIKAIETLSKNDENTVLAKRIGDIHGDYDRDIEAVTGLKKPDGVKTYNWLKNDILPKVNETKDVEQKLKDAQEEVKTLKDQVKKGSNDETLKKQLEDSQNLVTDLKQQLDDEKTESKTKLDAAHKQNANILLDVEFSKATQGLTFKDENIISKATRETVINAEKAKLLQEYEADWIDDGDGGKKLVFRKDGVIQNNKENGLNPFTAQELLVSRIGDVIDQGKQQGGAGTKPGSQGGQTSPETLDLSQAKTQVEADEMTKMHLMDKGLARGTAEYQEEFSKIRDENNVGDLPTQ